MTQQPFDRNEFRFQLAGQILVKLCEFPSQCPEPREAASLAVACANALLERLDALPVRPGPRPMLTSQ